MIRRPFAVTIHVVICILLIGCATATPTPPPAPDTIARSKLARDMNASVSPADISAVVGGNNAFAFDLYRQAGAQNQSNLIFSPYSISQAFAMLYAGARGDTEKQIASVMHFTLPQKELHPAVNALNLMLEPPPDRQPTPQPTSEYQVIPDELRLNIANSLWGQVGFPVEPAYLDTLALNYGAGMHTVDFAGDADGARQAINRWVSDATNGKIPDIASPDSVTEQTRLVLANAIYFKGQWTWPFQAKQTHDAPFTRLDGSQVTVPMMVNGFADLRCGRLDGYSAVEMGYGIANHAAMMVILPDAGQFARVETALNAETLDTLRSSIQPTNALTFSMPRFKFDSGVDLAQALSAMGMSLPFTGGADFSGIAANQSLFVSAAVHKAAISVDENGTEAAGASMLAMAMSLEISDCGQALTADRPFIFAIYDGQTGTILFLGRVLDPSG